MNANYYYFKDRYVSVTYDAGEGEQWPTRSLIAKGMTGKTLFASRPMTAEEIAEAKASPRYLRWKYVSWAGLMADEAEAGAAPDFLAKLECYAANHPLPG